MGYLKEVKKITVGAHEKRDDFWCLPLAHSYFSLVTKGLEVFDQLSFLFILISHQTGLKMPSKSTYMTELQSLSA